MEPAGTAGFSSPSSRASGQAGQFGRYTVPPASPVESTGPITAVRRANSAGGTSAVPECQRPRDWKPRRSRIVQLSVKSSIVHNAFLNNPRRARFAKTRARSFSFTENTSENVWLHISGIGSRDGMKSHLGAPVESSAKLTSKVKVQKDGSVPSNCKVGCVGGIPEDYKPRHWNWDEGTKGEASVLNPSGAAGNHPPGSHGERPPRARRVSVARRPAHRPPTDEDRRSLRAARPGGARRQLPGAAPRPRPGRGRGATASRPRDALPEGPTTFPLSPEQPESASDCIAEVSPTSDEFHTLPLSAPQRPASAGPPSRPKSPQPAAHHPTGTYKLHPASALPNTGTATKEAERPETRASSARTHNCNPRQQEDLLVLRCNSPHEEQSPQSKSLPEKPREDSTGASRNSSGNETSPPSPGTTPSTPSQLPSRIPPSEAGPDSRSTDAAAGEPQTTVSPCSFRETGDSDQPVTPHEDGPSSSDSWRFPPYRSDEGFSPVRTSAAAHPSAHRERKKSLESTPGDAQCSSPENCKPEASDTRESSTASARPLRPRAAAPRAELEERFRAAKRDALGDLRSDLGRRLKLRRESGIMGDEVFRKQVRSSFWTSDMLYHRWGSDILARRQRWASSTGRLEGPSDRGEEEGAGPRVPRGRRGALSNERTERSLLDFEALRSISTVNESQHPRSPSVDMPKGSPVTSQVSFSGHRGARRVRVTTTESVRSANRTQGSSVEVRPHAPRSLSGVDVGLRPPTHAHEDPEDRRLRLRALFVETVAKVQRAARVAFCMIRSSKDRNAPNFMAQLHFYNTRTVAEELTFEKERFSRKYSKLHVPKWAREISLKPAWDRSPDDVMAIYGILKHLKSFERFTHQMRMEICRAATYSCCEKGRVVLRQGHVGRNFYFIFSGSVFVQTDIEDETTGTLTPSTTHVMEKGTSFGELALLGGGAGNRGASIICRETTELFEIEKATFLDLCPDIVEKELQEKISAAKNVEIFRQIPAKDLERLCFESNIEEVAYGRVIERDTARTDAIYFVLSGKVTMLKAFDLPVAHKDASIQAYGDRSLPSPRVGRRPADRGRQTLLPATAAKSCFMRVGELRDGDCTEVAVMHADERRTSPGVILISNGVRLMQMSKRKLEQFAPKEVSDRLRRQPLQTLRIPSSEVLHRNYLGDLSWSEFKSKVMETLRQERKGAAIASKPFTAKGWARWPGSGVIGAPSCAVRPPTVGRRGMVTV